MLRHIISYLEISLVDSFLCNYAKNWKSKLIIMNNIDNTLAHLYIVIFLAHLYIVNLLAHPYIVNLLAHVSIKKIHTDSKIIIITISCPQALIRTWNNTLQFYLNTHQDLEKTHCRELFLTLAFISV